MDCVETDRDPYLKPCFPRPVTVVCICCDKLEDYSDILAEMVKDECRKSALYFASMDSLCSGEWVFESFVVTASADLDSAVEQMRVLREEHQFLIEPILITSSLETCGAFPYGAFYAPASLLSAQSAVSRIMDRYSLEKRCLVLGAESPPPYNQTARRLHLSEDPWEVTPFPPMQPI